MASNILWPASEASKAVPPKWTESEAIRGSRGARQFYIATNHVRQRQALFTGCEEQVDSLYGINEGFFDPRAANMIKVKQRIEVPVIEKVTGTVCGGIRLCGPQCMPPCPPENLGKPVVNTWYKTECCLKDLPLGFDTDDESTCTATLSKPTSKSDVRGGSKKQKSSKSNDDDAKSTGGKSIKSTGSKSKKDDGKSDDGKSTKSGKSKKTNKTATSDQDTFDEESKSFKVNRSKSVKNKN